MDPPLKARFHPEDLTFLSARRMGDFITHIGQAGLYPDYQMFLCKQVSNPSSPAHGGQLILGQSNTLEWQFQIGVEVS